MDENEFPAQRDNIRVDLYRVNNKILAQYKAGTPERKNFIRAKKISELKAATEAVSQITPESIAMILKLLRYDIAFGFGKLLLSWAVALMGAYVVDVVPLNNPGKVAFGCLAVLGVIGVYNYTLRIVQGFIEHRLITKNVNDAQEKLKRLINEVAELG